MNSAKLAECRELYPVLSHTVRRDSSDSWSIDSQHKDK